MAEQSTTPDPAPAARNRLSEALRWAREELANACPVALPMKCAALRTLIETAEESA